MEKAQRLELARRLVVELEADNEQQVAATLAELTEGIGCQDELFMQIGKLTRELHEAIKNFAHDQEVAELVQVDMPDAAERLQYVISTTESATHQTINAIEEMLNVSRRIKEDSGQLGQQWDEFMQRKLAYENFAGLCVGLKDFLQRSQQDGNKLHDTMNEILMAQGFQDITGQIIKKVIALVKDMESKLVDLVILAGHSHNSHNDEQLRKQKMAKEDGPAVPGVTQSDVMSSQDDVDDLLSSLGF